MKLFVRFLLLLCFVLLGTPGFGHVLLHTDNAMAVTVSTAKADSELAWMRLKATEIGEDDEDECRVSKKCSNPAKYFDGFLPLNVLRRHHSSVNNQIPFSRYLFYSSQHRYIMYRVIRV